MVEICILKTSVSYGILYGVVIWFARRDAAAVNVNLQVRKLKQDLEEAEHNYKEVSRVCMTSTRTRVNGFFVASCRCVVEYHVQ